ncbi:pyrroline-5-carboxylate reductase [Baia soyae]|uniref:Pyrroline-5-carboxylate reductase n=1 Tax=Baia soyae TaxID=1544746 RepID=A0A4R2RS86_9BACL|nr:pyrroline-5-carboxylate reductase [Baia soyae]TCP66048.1 pyrroline-5-carboxylate reductase [Baia soyae]
MKRYRVLVIGAGRMAEAIFAGLLRTQVEYVEGIVVTNRRNAARLVEIEEKYDVTVTHDWREYIGSVDVVLLSVLPQDHRELLTELAPHIRGQLVITVAAGIGLGLLEEMLPANTPVAWVMPNTASRIGESISLYTCGQHVSPAHRRMLEVIVAGIGEAVECTEEQVHNLTAITGSAPAFLYLFTEVLEEVAQEYGVKPEMARKLVVQMLFGSVAMLQQGEEPAKLRDDVTTPGGVTAAGIEVLEKRGFHDILRQTIYATNARAREMMD